MGGSQYAYMLCDDGIFRVNIPDLNEEHQHQFKLECVFLDRSCNISVRSMGAFSQGHDVYLVGGTDIYNSIDNCSMFIFNPSNIEEYPIRDTHSLRKSSEVCKPMTYPIVLRAKNQIYFFSILLPYQEGYMESHFCFQSFDTTKNNFHPLPLPTPTDSAMSYCDISYAGHFVVYNYIYLFISRSTGVPEEIDKLYAFSFNTISSTWKEINSLLCEFEQQNIPIPHNHYGDIGLSHVFSDNTQILVALDIGTPTAYRVSVGDDGGALHPKSYRRLIQLKHRGGHENTSHLLDIGGQRFCVIYCTEDTPLLVYVFKMKFEVEYENQRNSTSVPKPSIKILCSKKFKHPIPLYRVSMAHNVCLASAPASPTCFPCDEVKHSSKSKSKDSVQRMPGVPILEF